MQAIYTEDEHEDRYDPQPFEILKARDVYGDRETKDIGTLGEG